MSKCLVTGGAGFIGSHVVDLLLENGHEVTVLDNYSTGNNHNGKATEIDGDIRNPLVWADIGKFDYVFHLAALARIQPSIDDPIEANDVNVNGTLQVLEYCRQHKAKLIFSGSSSIYGGNYDRISEISRIWPKSPYALQKHIDEEYIRLYNELFGLQYTILRYFNVYGERQILDGAYAAVVGILLQQKADGKKMTITGDGEQRRDFTYVKDVAKANMMAMNWENSEYNIGTGKNYSVNELANEIGGLRQYLPKRRGEARTTLANNNKATRAGWLPTMDIKDWIALQ